MLSRDLRLYLLLICLPAAVLTALGVAFLARQSAAAAAREAEIREARAQQVAQAVREQVLEDRDAPPAREVLLDGLEVGAGRRPDGVFAWKPRTGLVRERGLPDTVASNLAARVYLKDWTDGSPAATKKPPLCGELVLPAEPAP